MVLHVAPLPRLHHHDIIVELFHYNMSCNVMTAQCTVFPQQCLVAQWLWLSITVRVRARAREWIFFFSVLKCDKQLCLALLARC